MSYIGASELVFNNKDGIYSGGFNVQSIMMKGGISPIMTLNNNGQNGGSLDNVSDIFAGLVVPAYAYQSGGSTNKGNPYKVYEDDSDDDVIDDDLHDKLLGLVKEHENKLNQNERKKKRTRKHIKTKKTTTKKYNKREKIEEKMLR